MRHICLQGLAAAVLLAGAALGSAAGRPQAGFSPVVPGTGLAFVQPGEAAKLEMLLSQLHSKDVLKRIEAAFLLGRMGKAAHTAIPALRAALADPDPDVREVASTAIRRIEAAVTVGELPAPGTLVLVRGRAVAHDKLARDGPKDPVHKTPVKEYLVTLQKGKTYVIDLISTQFDSYLRLENNKGKELAHDDDSGGNLNARIRFLAPQTEVYKIFATSFTDSVQGDFTLTVQELADRTPGTGTIPLPLVNGSAEVSGAIGINDPKDKVRQHPCKIYTVRFVGGETYQIDMRSTAIDSYLRLEDASRKELAHDDDGGGFPNARIVFHTPSTGTYRIIATTFAGQFGPFTLTIKHLGTVAKKKKKDKTPTMEGDLPISARIVASRLTLSHGRLDDLRATGYGSPANPKGQMVSSILTLFKVIAGQPNPKRITLDVNDDATGPRDPANPSPVLLASAPLPSGMTLLVAELGDAKLSQSVIRWDQAVPRFGNGNYYATVTIKMAGIVAGQELVTKQHFDAYTANSILWEAPDFGLQVMPRDLEGGTTNLGVWVMRGKNPKNREELTLQVGWADPSKLELAEAGQNVLMNPKAIRLRIQATLPAGFEPKRVIRWAAQTDKATIIGEAAATVVRPNRITFFNIDLPPDTTGSVRISAVASPGPFVRSLASVQADAAVGFDTFHSRGSTLEDVISVQVKGDLGDTIDDKLKKANAKSGDVQVSLYWQSKDDLDLHVIGPSGEEIFYNNRRSRDGGELDVDMNVNYDTAVIGAVENIFWPKGKAPPGKYKVYVHHYSHHGGRPGTADPASFNVRVLIRGQAQFFSGNVSFQDASRRRVLVSEFEVK